jgi:hypothetical protein
MIPDRLDRPFQIDGVPQDDGGRHQSESGGTIALVLKAAVALYSARDSHRLADVASLVAIRLLLVIPTEVEGSRAVCGAQGKMSRRARISESPNTRDKRSQVMRQFYVYILSSRSGVL